MQRTPDEPRSGTRERFAPAKASRLPLRGLAALFVGAWVPSPAAEPPQLRGIMVAKDHWLASLSVDLPREQRWCAAGERIGEFVIEAIDANSATLVDGAGSRHLVTLPGSRVIDASAPPTDPIVWKQWVNSRANPMLLGPAGPPVPFTRWRELPATKREEIAQWYRLHGWSLSVELDAQGPPHAEFSPLQSDERQAITAKKEHTFLSSLSGQQRVLYNESQRARTTESVERFKASLDPVRRDAFERLRDFTEPLPAELRR